MSQQLQRESLVPRTRAGLPGRKCTLCPWPGGGAAARPAPSSFSLRSSSETRVHFLFCSPRFGAGSGEEALATGRPRAQFKLRVIHRLPVHFPWFTHKWGRTFWGISSLHSDPGFLHTPQVGEMCRFLKSEVPTTTQDVDTEEERLRRTLCRPCLEKRKELFWAG